MKPFDLIVVGDLNAELVLTGDVVPQFGQVEKLVEDATLTMGSSAGIFACAAARLGLRVAMVGKVGPDDFGRFVLNYLADRNIDTRGMVVDERVKTGLGVILSRGNDRAILTYLGSIAELRYQDIDLSLLEQARHLHLGSYFLLDGLRPDLPRLFAQARNQGLTVSLDTNYDPAETWNGGLAETLAQTDIFLPNTTELYAISGLTELEPALAHLAGHIPLIAVKLGEAGAVAQRGTEQFRADPLPVRVVDTTGAGDSFDAGFLYGYLAGWDVAKALRLGCVCGALSTRAAGGTAAQATLPEALALL